MIRSILGFCLLATATLFSSAAQAQDSNSPALGVVWCQIDDPAAWNNERSKMILQGVEDLSNVPCPSRKTGPGLPEVLSLPMPCGRVMLFNRIDVPVSHALDHVVGNFGRSVDIDAETPQTVFSNGPWVMPVSGAFSLLDTQTGEAVSDRLRQITAKSYYIAKYELTAVQWEVFESGLFTIPADATEREDSEACKDYVEWLSEQNLRRIYPIGGLSWFDTIEFSREYSNWLLARDRDRIDAGLEPQVPWEQGATGYVRVPTEAEWEFAARGGAAFATAQSRSQRLPAVLDATTGKLREASLDDVCADAPRAPGQYFSAVGQNDANAFGLYDVVCNAEEIVLDLFRPTRPDGLGGQVGGVVTKGGSSVLFREGNTVGRRSEAQALFGLEGAGSTPTMGVRLSLSAPVFTGRRDEGAEFVEGMANQPLEDEMIASRTELLEGGSGLASGSSVELTSEVNKLRRAVRVGEFNKKEIEQQAEELQVQLERMNVALNQAAQERIRFSIRSGIVAGNLIDRIGRNLYAGMQRITALEREKNLSAQDAAGLQRSYQLITENERRIAATFDLYLQVHSELAKIDPKTIRQQILETKRGLSGASIDVFGPYLDVFEVHFDAASKARGQVTESMRKAWLGELDTVRSRRRQDFPKLQQ